MDKRIQIEIAICKDASRIHDINKESLPIYYSPREYVVYILDENIVLLKAVNEGNIIGYVLAKWYTVNRLHIMSFAVLPAYRRLGVGKLLINKIHCTKYTNKAFTQLTLYVQTSNKIALKFYENNGFIKHIYLKDYYGVNDHGYYMIKKTNQ